MTEVTTSPLSELRRQAVSEISTALERLRPEDFDTLVTLCDNHSRIFLAGVGREGLSTRAFAMRLMHLGKEAHWIWDDTTPSMGAGDLLICTSGDGGIGHLDYVCRRAREAGAHVHLVTGSRLGITAREVAHSVTFLPAHVYRGQDDVVASGQLMGALFEQSALIMFDCTAQALMTRLDASQREAVVARHRNVE